jgi:hypothetical protein
VREGRKLGWGGDIGFSFVCFGGNTSLYPEVVDQDKPLSFDVVKETSLCTFTGTKRGRMIE